MLKYMYLNHLYIGVAYSYFKLVSDSYTIANIPVADSL